MIKRADMLVGGQFLLFGLLGVGFIVLPVASEGVVRIAGLLVMLLGVLIGLAAIYQHQATNNRPPKVSPVPNESAGLVQVGLYKSIRHPIYTGVLTAALGGAIANGHPLMFLFVILLYGWMTMKSRYEETLLRQTYADYAAYMERSGRFIPPLRR